MTKLINELAKDEGLDNRGQPNFVFFLFFGARKRIFYFSSFYFSAKKDIRIFVSFRFLVLKWP